MRTDEDAKQSILALESLYDVYKYHEYLKDGWDEFTSINIRKRPIEQENLYTDDEQFKYIDALTMGVIRLSLLLKVSRYSIAKAIIANMEANH